jgi:penicillin-binding protein 2
VILLNVWRAFNPRLKILAVLMGALLAVLLLKLFSVQIVHGPRYGSRQEAQSLRRIRIPSARGEIFDRNGVPLAQNRPSYDIVIYLEELQKPTRKVDIASIAGANLSALSHALGAPVTLSDREVRIHYQLRRPLPLKVYRDVRPELVAAFAERASGWEGCDLLVTPLRQYNNGSLAAHVLGFVGRPQTTPEDELDKFYYYQPDIVGKQGVEAAFDDDLRGAPGGRTIRINVHGYREGEVAVKPATMGQSVVLTVDAKLQKIAEDALDRAPVGPRRRLKGAVVVLDPRNGDVLAMASRPTFDPNLFNPGGDARQISAILNDADAPLLNRAVSGRYAPGSIFKMIPMLAGLENGVINAETRARCDGFLIIGAQNQRFGCWRKDGHGIVDMHDALKKSCDVFFYQRGMAMGPAPIRDWSLNFGLGQRTGFELGGETAGLVPDADWKRARFGEGWWDGDSAQLAIGQSFLEVTPLQMARMTAALANGGTLWRPRIVDRVMTPTGEIVKKFEPQRQGSVPVSPRNMEIVRRAMLAAVQDVDGTGHRAAVRGVPIAGKTGTAEFGPRERRIKRAWFVGFAPYERPELAVAVVIDDGDSGGMTAAPVAGAIFAHVFGGTSVEAGGAAAYGD